MSSSNAHDDRAGAAFGSADQHLIKLLLESPQVAATESVGAARERIAELWRQCKPPDPELIKRLEARGNSAENWSRVLLGPEFNVEYLRGTYLMGDCILMGVGNMIGAHPAGVFHSTIQDSILDTNVTVHHCCEITGYYIGVGARLLGSRLVVSRPGMASLPSSEVSTNDSIGTGGPGAFSLSARVEAGIETGGRSLPLLPSLTLEAARLIAENPADPQIKQVVDQALIRHLHDFNGAWAVVDKDAQIIQTRCVRNSYIGCGALVEGAEEVLDSVVLSSHERPTQVGGGASLRSSLMQENTSLNGGALVRSSILLSGSGVEEGGRVSNCLVAAGTVIGGGEATASFVGPFVGFHHSSLLIAAYWPDGRGNLGYGANIGSNHSSRMPDQEIHPGEGMFFGLDTVVKFPAYFRHAPYTIIASGVATLPQRFELPFSLILEAPAGSPDRYRGLNQVMPGWMLNDNLYALVRAEMKFRKRSLGLIDPDLFNPSPFRAEIARLVQHAHDRLLSIEESEWYGPRELPELGKTVLRHQDRVKAIRAYSNYLTLMRGRHLVNTLESTGAEPNAEEKSLLRSYCEIASELPTLVIDSRQKDMERGKRIIPDYDRTHQAPDEEEIIREFSLTIKQECARARAILGSIHG